MENHAILHLSEIMADLDRFLDLNSYSRRNLVLLGSRFNSFITKDVATLLVQLAHIQQVPTHVARPV